MTMYCNIDINSTVTPFLNGLSEKESFSKEMLYPFIDMYKDTPVTDVLLCIFAQYSATDTKYWSTYADKYLQTVDNGETVDYKEYYRGIYKLNKEYGTDPYDVWIKRCKEIGKNAWISVRMNDCHVQSWLKSEFFYKAKENGWLLGKKYGYFGECLNYKIGEIRKMMLDYIKEQIERYDVDGIELDFMREMYCFDYIDDNMDECIKIMNDFIRDVKSIVNDAEKKYGHKIKIAIRLNRDINQSLAFGFDARTWAKEKLVDVIIPSPRWSNCDSGIPIEVWKKELDGVEILGCLETLLSSGALGIAYMTAETARGLSASLLSAGVDAIYLYNYFGEGGRPRDAEVQKTCASIEDIYNHRTRCVVMCQEKATCPQGFERWMPLPLELTDGECKSISVRNGKIPENKKVKLVLGFEKGEPNDLKILLNGEEITNFKECKIDEPENVISENTKCYSASIKVLDEIEQCIEFVATKGNAIINWAEIIVE
ncbi:MAG: hypothetical protein IKW59_05105 [Clostridia bacterium]|nr:hypothetical protein [Clostridia bacterium]